VNKATDDDLVRWNNELEALINSLHQSTLACDAQVRFDTGALAGLTKTLLRQLAAQRPVANPAYCLIGDVIPAGKANGDLCCLECGDKIYSGSEVWQVVGTAGVLGGCCGESADTGMAENDE
jgi:hypothetical protein